MNDKNSAETMHNEAVGHIAQFANQLGDQLAETITADLHRQGIHDHIEEPRFRQLVRAQAHITVLQMLRRTVNTE